MSEYYGLKHRNKCDAVVYKDGKEFDYHSSLALANHSPTGFEWGYNGSGPAQLALALLYDATGDKELALQWAYDFKEQIVARWHLTWYITSDAILAWIKHRIDDLAFEKIVKGD